MENDYDAHNPDIKDENGENDFEQMLEESLKVADSFAPGDSVSGTIVFLTEDSVFVDISGKSEAVIDISEFRNDKGEVTVKPGDRVEGFIVSTGGGEIHITTTIGRTSASSALLELAYQNAIPVQGLVTGMVKGGYSVSVSGKRCFCPGSQMDVRRSSSEEDYLNKWLAFKITEFAEGGRNIILSRRTLLEEEKGEAEEKLKSTLAIGDRVHGTVSSVKDFGVFVSLDGVDALVPRVELSRSRQVKPSDFSTGMEIDAVLKSADWETMRLTLSIKDATPDPWEGIDKYTPGETVTGKVINIIKAGAFVEIEPGMDGFLHISRMSMLKKVSKPEDILAIGDDVIVKINKIDKEKKKISLDLVTDEVNPWEDSPDTLHEEVHTAVIETTAPAGLTVRLSNGMPGFVPSRELIAERGSDLQKMYPEGAEIKVIVLEVNSRKRELRLSEKAAVKQEERETYKKFMKKESDSASSTLGSQLKNQLEEIQKNLK